MPKFNVHLFISLIVQRWFTMCKQFYHRLFLFLIYVYIFAPFLTVVITFCCCSCILFSSFHFTRSSSNDAKECEPTDKSTDRPNEWFFVVVVIIRSSFVGWKLIATKMKNIKWLNLWGREVKIGNRVWESRIMFAFCVCVCVLWHLVCIYRVRVRHKYIHIHIHLYIYVYTHSMSDRVLWVF